MEAATQGRRDGLYAVFTPTGSFFAACTRPADVHPPAGAPPPDDRPPTVDTAVAGC